MELGNIQQIKYQQSGKTKRELEDIEQKKWQTRNSMYEEVRRQFFSNT